MIYKVPMPNGTNGVKLFTLPNQQIGVEYQRGEPKVGAMAYDSAHGLSRDVSFGGGATEGNAGISDETIDKLLEFLETVLPPQMMDTRPRTLWDAPGRPGTGRNLTFCRLSPRF